MIPPPTSSLKRFLQRQGKSMVGHSQMATAAQILAGTGGSLVAVGLTLLIVGLLTHTQGLLFGSIGPIIAGISQAVAGRVIARRTRADGGVLELSPDARQLLAVLLVHYDVASRAQMGSYLRRDVPLELSPQVLEELESVASGANRVHALIQTSIVDSGAGAGPSARRLDRAVRELMADAFHHAAVMSKYPEGSGAARQKLGQIRASMREIAEGVEQLAGRTPSFGTALGNDSVSEVLEELRVTNRAHEELRQRISEN